MKRWYQRLRAWLHARQQRAWLDDRRRRQDAVSTYVGRRTQHCDQHCAESVTTPAERDRQMQELNELRQRIDTVRRETWLDTEAQVMQREGRHGE